MNLIRVTDIEPRDGLKLKVFFNDGLSGVLDFSSLLTGAIFSALKDQGKFASATVRYGTIVWDGDIDMAPEYLHAKMVGEGVGLNRLSAVSQP